MSKSSSSSSHSSSSNSSHSSPSHASTSHPSSSHPVASKPSSSSVSTAKMTAAYTQAANSMKGMGVSSIGGRSSKPAASSGATYTSSANKAKNVAAAAHSKITAAYQQAANSLKGTGVLGIGGKSTSAKSGATYTSAANVNKNIAAAAAYKAAVKLTGPSYSQEATRGMNQIASNKAVGNSKLSKILSDGSAGAVGALTAFDGAQAYRLRVAASKIVTNGPAIRFPSNVSKANEFVGTDYFSKVKAQYKFSGLDSLSGELPTKAASKSATYISTALKSGRPISLGTYGRMVKNLGIVGALVDPALGAYEGVSETPTSAKLSTKITAGIVGGLKRVDTVVVSGVSGGAAGVAAFETGPAAVAVGVGVGYKVGQLYDASPIHKSFTSLIDSSAPYIESGVSAGITVASYSYGLGKSAYAGIGGALGIAKR